MLQVVDLGFVLGQLSVDVISLLLRRDALLLDVLLESLSLVGFLPLVWGVLEHEEVVDPEVFDEDLELSHVEPVGSVGKRDIG